jgi:hypothetical protein
MATWQEGNSESSGKFLSCCLVCELTLLEMITEFGDVNCSGGKRKSLMTSQFQHVHRLRFWQKLLFFQLIAIRHEIRIVLESPS